MSIDVFDKAFQDWLHGVQWQEKVRREDANITELVNTLQKRGHVVTCDYLNRSISVDDELTVTMRIAREEKPEMLLRWVEERMSMAKERKHNGQ